MKEGIKELAEAGGDSTPNWLNKIDEIVSGINKMLDSYQAISGKTQPAQTAQVVSSPSNFFEARAAKKAEVAARAKVSNNSEERINEKEVIMSEQNDEIKQILEGLIRSIRTLQTMGFGEKKIGEVILELPFSVDQTEEFMSKLYAAKYPQ